ncbi:MAG: energy-coupled thiamine transporter ThiT [Bacilli bacterium]
MENTVSSRRTVSKSVSQITISAMMLALAVILCVAVKYLPGFSFPNGGTVSIAMVPLVFCALICGPFWGVFIGVAFAVIDMALDGGAFGYHWLCILLDYVFAFGGVGLASIFRKPFFEKKVYAPIVGMLISGLFRFVCSFFSGCIVWSQLSDFSGKNLAPDFSAGGIIYSITYNGGYILPSIALSVFVIALVAKPIFNLLNLNQLRILAPSNLDVNKEVVSKISFTSLEPIYIGSALVLSIVGSIPALKIYWMGYFSLVMSVALLVFSIVMIIKSYKGKEAVYPEGSWMKKFKNPKSIYYLFGLSALIILGISLLAILSYYTYGAETYYVAEEVSSLI